MRKRNKMSMSVSFDNEMIDRIDEHVVNHHMPSFSAFVREAVSYYLDHNPNVSTVSINDSEPTEQPIDIIDDVVKEALKDIPKDTEPPPNDDAPNVKNNFNFDDIE